MIGANEELCLPLAEPLLLVRLYSLADTKFGPIGAISWETTFALSGANNSLEVASQGQGLAYGSWIQKFRRAAIWTSDRSVTLPHLPKDTG